MTLLYVAGAIVVVLAISLVVARWGTPQCVLESDQEIAQAAREGRVTLAVRSYRELHGVGLKRAKEAVKALATESSNDSSKTKADQF